MENHLREVFASDKGLYPYVFSLLGVRHRVLNYFFLSAIFLAVINIHAQERNFQTTIGLGVGTSFPGGNFKTKQITDFDNAFASKPSAGFKFILEQNLGKRFGVCMNFYSMYFGFDYSNFEKSLMLDNRGLAPDIGQKFEVRNTGSEWAVDVSCLGAYYYKNLGKRDNFRLEVIASMTITDMLSPEMVIDVKDANNNILETRNIESAETWREVFLLPPVDGFSLEVNAQYFFSKHFSVIPSVCFISSTGHFDGQNLALYNLSRIRFLAFNATLGVSYTIFYNKK
jgi:hypothetical protein